MSTIGGDFKESKHTTLATRVAEFPLPRNSLTELCIV